MRSHLLTALLAICLGACVNTGGTGTLSPASPQPAANRLAPGLAVAYAYPPEVRTLRDARAWLDRIGEPGPPLAGLDYPDTGGKALTSTAKQRVAADITGFIRFDAPGAYRLEFQNNDGLEVQIGGVTVYRDDSRHPCQSRGAETVSVPAPGWYPFHAVFFQRLNTSCLRLLWQPPGAALGPAPAGVFAHAVP